jgi:predicted ATPase
LENFELPIADRSSVLLIGKNGSGKTTVGLALEILQKIAGGVNLVDSLVKPKDFSRGRADVPMRFEIEVGLGGQTYEYIIAFDSTPGTKGLQIFEERLVINGNPLFTRQLAQVHLPLLIQKDQATFPLDRNVAVLPLMQEPKDKGPLSIFKQWLARSLILRPIPSLISGNSEEETLRPNPQGTDFGAWFSALLASAPAAYGKIDQYLKQVMPDFKEIKNPVIGKDSRSLEVQFSNNLGNVNIPFADLSDGEKCFIICAVVLAANDAYGPLLCFWDEPDNYLALSEVGHFVMDLRKAFQSGGQFICTSHNDEAIRRFSDENTLILYRKNHLEPTQVRPLTEIKVHGDLVSALIRDDVDP